MAGGTGAAANGDRRVYNRDVLAHLAAAPEAAPAEGAAVPSRSVIVGSVYLVQ